MHRIDGPGATVDHKFTEGNPATSVQATTVTDDWLNAIQEEISAVIEAGGGALDKNNNAQLLAKINSLITAAIPSNVPQGVSGSRKNLVVTTTGLSGVVTVTAEELTLLSSGGVYKTLQNVSVTPSFANAGVNGLDVGAANSQTANTWYYVWVISNGTTTAGLLSLSRTNPTMPAGYTSKALVSCIRTDGTANKFFVPWAQFNDLWQYTPGAGKNLTALPVMSSGAIGNPTGPVWAAIAVGSVVPPNSSEIAVVVFAQTTGAMAPNSNYGGTSSATNPPPWTWVPGTTTSKSDVLRFLLESTNIFGIFTSAASSVGCLGGRLNL